MPAAPVTLRWADRVADVPADLWSRCFPPPLEGPWWYATVEAAGVDDQFTFAYAVLERRGQPVGIAPTFVFDVPLDLIAPDRAAAAVRTVGRFVRRLRYQRTLFVGSPFADEGTVGLVPDVALADVLTPLQDALDRRAAFLHASMIVWKDFPDADVPALSAERRLFRVSSFPGTRLPLPPGGFAGYLAALDAERRHKLKKKLRRGTAAVPTVATVVQHPDPATRAELWPLFWQTYLKGKTKFERLSPRFFDAAAAQPTSHFVLLRHATTGRLVAFMHCLDCRPRLVNKFIGLDYAAPPDGSLYFQLWAAAVAWAADARFTELQSGQTGYRFKLDCGNRLVPLTNFARHRNPLVHRLFAWQARGITWSTLDPDLRQYLTAHPQQLAAERAAAVLDDGPPAGYRTRLETPDPGSGEHGKE